MNKILKKFLETARDVAIETATQSLPGAGIAIGGVTKLFDKDNSNNSAAIVEIESGVIEAIQSLDSSALRDSALVAQGLADLKKGFDELKRGLK